MQKPLFIEKGEWKGQEFISEIYSANDFSNLNPVTRVQAVSFLESGEIVIFGHKDGWKGFPGGQVETGETLEEALSREIMEEISAELLSCTAIAYEKVYPKGKPEKANYFVCFRATIKILDQPINDPANKSVERIIAKPESAIGTLGWGKKGEILINLALESQ